MVGPKPIAVVVSDDSKYAGALAAALSAQFDVKLFDSTESARIEEVIEDVAPKVFVHDVGATLELNLGREAAPFVPTLVLGPDDPGRMIEAVESGVLGYLSRDATFKEIEQGVVSIAQGTAVIPPLMLGSLLHHVVERRRGQSAALEQLDGLTPRENEVFRLAAMGLGHDGIAERLFMSAATARTHLHRIFKKLDIHSKAELVALAAACGLPTTEDL